MCANTHLDVRSFGYVVGDRLAATLRASHLWDVLLDTSKESFDLGFAHVSVGPCFTTSHLVSFLSSAGKEKNRNVRVSFAHSATQFKPVDLGQPGLKQIHVKALSLNCRQGLSCAVNQLSFNFRVFQNFFRVVWVRQFFLSRGCGSVLESEPKGYLS